MNTGHTDQSGQLRATNTLQIGALAVGLAAMIAWLTYLSVYQVDDAFIVFRYAENLVNGNGLTYNPGVPVDGISCFLWTILLAALAGFGLSLPTVAPIATALCGLIIVMLLPGISARMRAAQSAGPVDWAAAIILATHPAFAYWSVGSLETVPYALLLLLALHDHARERERGVGMRSAIWAGLATLMRPEAPLLVLALGLDRLWWRQLGSSTKRLRSLITWGAITLCFFVPLLLFRWQYFGDLLPNTYYAKSGVNLGTTLRFGWTYTADFLAHLVPGFGASGITATLLGGLLLVGLAAYGLSKARLRPLVLMTLALAIAIMLEGGDWMLLHRFWVPALPWLAILIAAIAGAAIRWNLFMKIPLAGLVVITIASQLIYGIQTRDGVNGLAINAAGYELAHKAIAQELKKRGQPTDEVAVMDIGMIGYYSGLKIFDISGLVEPDVARSEGGFLNKRYPVQKILDRKPRFMVLVNGFPIDTRIFNDMTFQRDYRIVMKKNHRDNWTPKQYYVLHLFERKR